MVSNGYRYNMETDGLGEVFFKYMTLYKNKIAQVTVDTDEKDTYGDILTRSVRTAIRLKEEGFGQGDIISSCSHNQKHSCIPFIAAQFIGAFATSFDPKLSHLDTIGLLKLTEPKIMFVAQECLEFMENCIVKANIKTKLVVFGNSTKYSLFEDYIKSTPKEHTFTVTPIKNNKETAVIMFSSGTTGIPKGICLSHYCLLGQIDSDGFFEMKGRTNMIVNPAAILLFPTLYWISAVLCLMKSIIGGGIRIVCPKFEPANFWNIVEMYKVSFVFLAPYQVIEILHHPTPKYQLGSLKTIAVGGSTIAPTYMENLRTAAKNAAVIQGYGQTEFGGVITVFDVAIPEELELNKRKPESCGRMRAYHKWKVVDPSSGKPLGKNQKGELLLKSDYMTHGYYKMDSSSAFDDEGYMKTGDIVYFDDDYCFYIVDRIKEMFKYKSWHVVPAVVESVVCSHPAVKDAVVIGIPHVEDGDHPMAVVSLKDNLNVTAEEIQEFVDRQVSEVQKLRAGVKIVSDIPRTPTGKCKKNFIREKVLNGDI